MNVLYMLILSSMVFCIGVWGLLTCRRNIMILLMSLEIMYLAANLNFACYTYCYGDIMGIIFIIYTLTIVGAESCIGLSLIATYYVIHKDVSMNTMEVLRR